MTSSFEFKAKHGLKKVKNLSKFKGIHSAKVGVLRGTGDHPNAPGIPIALIAWWNEFGTRHIPSRPFLRTTLREHDYYKKEVAGALRNALLNAASFTLVSVNAEHAKQLRVVGAIAVDDIQKKIIDGPWIPNSDATIARKSTSSGEKARPLIESGKMRQSIAYAVVND